MARDAAPHQDAELTRAVLEGAIGALPLLFRVPSCAVLLPSAERNVLRAVARRELSEPQVQALIELLAQREIAALLADGRPFLPRGAEGISPALRDRLRSDGWPDLIAVPLPGTGRPVGVLVLIPDGDGRWSPPRVEAALKTGQWLATSLRAAVRAGEGERRRRQVAGLLERLPLLRSGMAPEEASAAVAAGVGEALGVSHALAVLLRPEVFAEYAQPGVAPVGSPSGPAAHPMWSLLRGGGTWRYDEGEASPADRAATARLLNGLHPRAALVAPVRRDRELEGYLVLIQAERHRRFSDEELQFVHAALAELADLLAAPEEPSPAAATHPERAPAAAAALAAAASPDDVAAALWSGVAGDAPPEGLVLACWDPAVRRWKAVAVRAGGRALPLDRFPPAPLGDDLLSEALRAATPVRGPAAKALPRAWRAPLRADLSRTARAVAVAVPVAAGRAWTVAALTADEAAAVRSAPAVVVLAPAAALSLDRLELAGQSALRERRLHAVNEMLSITSTAGDLSAACDQVAALIRRELPGVDLIVIWLLDIAGETLHRVFISGDAIPHERITRTTLSFESDSGPARILRSGNSTVWQRADADMPELMRSFMERADVNTVAVVPMRTARGVSGTFTLCSLAPRHYSPEELAFLETVAGQLGGQLDAVQLRASAEDERRRLRSMLDALPEGLLLVDRSEAVRMFSPATERILGVPLEGATIGQIYSGMHLARSDGREVAPSELPLRRALQGISTTATEMLLVRPDASETLLLESCRPVRDASGSVTGAVCVLQDLSSLQELSSLKSDFINTVSHELRTPITTIRGGALTLLKRRHLLDDQTQNDLLTDIAEEAERLHLLVSDLLSLTRSRSGMNVNPEPVLLGRLVDRVIMELGGRVGGHDLHVGIPAGLPPADADPELTQQILRNLLENAVKFSPRGGPVNVEAEQQDSELVVSVLDRGSGVPAEDLDRVFEPFYRPDATKRSGAQGAGLGLAVCRRLVEMQGGRIWAEAREGGGAVFRFTLPIAAAGE